MQLGKKMQPWLVTLQSHLEAKVHIDPHTFCVQLRSLAECNVGLLCSFDEVYYGQYISFYMKRIFFLDGSGPPFGHMLLALGGRIP